MGRIPVLLLILMIAEVASIMVVGRALGFWVTLALMLLAPMAGSTLIRVSGVSFAQAMQMGGQQPGNGLARKGLFQFAAGVLLIIPGFLSDALAGLLLLPPVQALLAQRFRRWFNVQTVSWPPPEQAETTIIEGEAVEILPPEQRISRRPPFE